MDKASGLKGAWLLAAAAALVAAAWQAGPAARDAWALRLAFDDPAALASLSLQKNFNADRLRHELAAALDADDVDLAASFFELAAQQRIAPPEDLRARYLAATTPAATAARGARDFYDGAVSGNGASGAGLAGVVVSDITGFGDLRDLLREGAKAARGEENDKLVLGLAVAGLAVTGATIATIGAALPARAGVSTVKTAAKAGRLSKPLAGHLARVVSEAVDVNAAGAIASAAARLDLTAARTIARDAIRPEALARLRGFAEDVTSIGKNAGVRGAQDALAIARDGEDLGRISRLAAARGASTRAVLKVLGRGAIVVVSGVLAMAGWVMAAVGWLWMALLITLAVAKRVVRVAWWVAHRTGRLTLAALRATTASRGRRLLNGGNAPVVINSSPA